MESGIMFSRRSLFYMKTIILKLDINEFNDNMLDQAAELLRNGGLVAFPTETVYGLGGNALDPEASKKIYGAKGRPSDNPLIVHISDSQELEDLVIDIPDKAKKLAEKFWPGPLTMVFYKGEKVPFATTGGLNTVAIRMPEHPIALALIRTAKVCVAAPSANTSGKPSPTLAQHVIDDLDGKVDMIIDGGSVGIGLESTIVDVTVDPPMILRPGYITKAKIEEVIGEVQIDPSMVSIHPDKDQIPKAPGMKYKHYAPKGDLTIWQGPTEKVVKAINKRAEELVSKGAKVGIISTNETRALYQYGIIKDIGSRKDEGSIARKLYAVLREFDDLGAEYILTESFESEELGQAIMNRLLKAAGYQIHKVEGGMDE